MIWEYLLRSREKLEPPIICDHCLPGYTKETVPAAQNSYWSFKQRRIQELDQHAETTETLKQPR